MAPRILGLAVVQLNFWVNTILASSLPSGSLSALNYAWLLMLLPQGIVAQGMATAAFPTFAALEAGGRYAELRRTLSSTLRAVLFLTIPAAAGLFVWRVPLVRMLFQRGAFTAQSTEWTAYALAFYAFGLIGHSLLGDHFAGLLCAARHAHARRRWRGQHGAECVLSLALRPSWVSPGWPWRTPSPRCWRWSCCSGCLPGGWTAWSGPAFVDGGPLHLGDGSDGRAAAVGGYHWTAHLPWWWGRPVWCWAGSSTCSGRPSCACRSWGWSGGWPADDPAA